MSDATEVRPGQVWADNDKRAKGRTVTVKYLETHTDPFSHRKITRANVLDSRGRVSRIRVDRFRPNSTGYRLIEDAPEKAGDSE